MAKNEIVNGHISQCLGNFIKLTRNYGLKPCMFLVMIFVLGFLIFNCSCLFNIRDFRLPNHCIIYLHLMELLWCLFKLKGGSLNVPKYFLISKLLIIFTKLNGSPDESETDLTLILLICTPCTL